MAKAAGLVIGIGESRFGDILNDKSGAAQTTQQFLPSMQEFERA